MMKNQFQVPSFLFCLLSILSVTFLFTGCSEEEPVTPEPDENTITDIVSSNSNFSLLESAVIKADLASTLGGTDQYTVFAPDDNAFESAGITSDVIGALSTEQLKNILLYHTLSSEVVSGDVPEGPNAEVESASGDTLYVTKNDNGVFINGVMVTEPDLSASNGVVHVIENVLMPPSGNLIETAQSNDDFSFLVAAVVRASEGSTNVAEVLSGAGPFTVFAPTNQAFMDAGFPDIASIQTADPNTLTSILTYHVIGSRIFSSDLTDEAQVITLNGNEVTIGLTDGATVTGNSNSESSSIISTNIIANNGVVHVIDQVLMP